MKKISLILSVVILLTAVLPMTVSAGALKVWENDPISMPSNSPIVDGVIDAGLYSNAAFLDELKSGYFWSTNPLTTKANVYFTYDDNGIYFAAEISEGNYTADIARLSKIHADVYWKDEARGAYMISNGKASAKFCDLNGNLLMADGVTLASATGNKFVQSTGEDNIEKTGETYGFNGDVFGVSFDPAGLMFGTDAGGNPITSRGISAAGYISNKDKAPAYLVSIVNGTPMIYKNVYDENGTVDYSNSGIIFNQSDAKVAAFQTYYGWNVEGFVSWNEIISNIQKTFPDVNLNKADILQKDAFIRASVIYQDRFIDPEVGDSSTWGRYITVVAGTATGSSGSEGCGTDVGSMGLKLFLTQTVTGGPPIRVETSWFNDVYYDDWYVWSVLYCAENGIMNGIGNKRFLPNNGITREQFIQIIANFERVDTSKYTGYTGYNDVPSGKWYSGAIKWATEQGITSGLWQGYFGLGHYITREQIVTMLCNYCGRKYPTAVDIYLPFYDAYDISDWAYNSVKWAYANAIIKGTSEHWLSPGDYTTRAQAAQIMLQYCCVYAR